MKPRRIAVVATALVSALAVAACGSSTQQQQLGSRRRSSGSSGSSSSGGSGTINGAGSTLAAPIYQQWASTLKGQGVTVNFNPVGSGAGQTELEGATVQFAGSDPALKPSDKAKMKGAVLQFPVAAGAITLSYNLQGVKSGLKLDGPTVAKIFMGQIKTWNDPAIKALNPGISLPSTNITVVHRSDSSGTTAGLHHVAVGRRPDLEVLDRLGQGRQVADRHRRQGQLGRRRRRQADRRRDRLRRAGVCARERFHVRGDQELGRLVRSADAPQHLGRIPRDQGSAGPRDLDDQLAEPGRVPDRVADVPGRVQGPVQGRRLQRAAPPPRSRSSSPTRSAPGSRRSARALASSRTRRCHRRWLTRTTRSSRRWSATGQRSRRGIEWRQAPPPVSGGRSALERSPLSRLPDRVLRVGTQRPGCADPDPDRVLLHPADRPVEGRAQPVRVQLRVRQRLGRLAEHLQGLRARRRHARHRRRSR